MLAEKWAKERSSWRHKGCGRNRYHGIWRYRTVLFNFDLYFMHRSGDELSIFECIDLRGIIN